MKRYSIIFSLALLVSGCASPSRFANDPRSARVGPAYLEAIASYPRDKDTQLYYPMFAVHEPTTSQDSGEPRAEALLIDIPEPTAAGSENQGKGWPDLERTGMPLFSPAHK